jgi:hypothetical protein
MESLIKHTNKFLTSPDDDQPGNKQYVVFNDAENYQLEGHTHGKLSHAIKHYEEFDKAGMDEILNSALDYLKSSNSIYLKTIKGEIIASGQQALNKITLNAVHNTFDLINDKIMKGFTLVHEEEILKTNFLIPLEKKYDALIATYITDHVQVSSLTEEELQLVYVSGKRLNFEGLYDEALYNYILDFSTSGLLVQLPEEKSICTLFRIDKQGNCLNEIKVYFSNNISLTSALLNKFLCANLLKI